MATNTNPTSPSKLQKISINVPPLKSHEETRQALVYSLNQIQNQLLGQLPITNLGGSRIQNVGVPQFPDDVVTLRYLQDQQAATTSASAQPGQGPFIRTLDLGDLTVGTNIAPCVPIFTPGQGIETEAVLRVPISSSLSVDIYRNAEVTPLFNVTIPAATGTKTALVTAIGSVSFQYKDVLWANITASDGQVNGDGIATITIVWK